MRHSHNKHLHIAHMAYHLLQLITLLSYLIQNAPFSTKIQGIATSTPDISYRYNDFSISCFCPFKSFCFSYRLLRSLQSSFMRSNCARTPSRQSGSACPLLLLTFLFKSCANTRSFLLQLHHLLWLADFLLPKCCQYTSFYKDTPRYIYWSSNVIPHFCVI